MSKKRNILRFLAGLFGLIFVLCVILFFSAAGLINSETAKERIHNFLIENTGAVVTYKNSEIKIFPVPEIIFHQVNIIASDKASGSVATLSITPDIWALMKGNTGISKVVLEAPHFSVRIGGDEKLPTLKEIEEKVRSVSQALVSKTPGLIVMTRSGRVDLTKSNKIEFSWDMIQSSLRTSQKHLEVAITCRSNLWDNLSLSSTLQTDDLRSEGSLRITHLHPNTLLKRLLNKTSDQIGVSDAEMLVKFETVGLTLINATMEGSVEELAVSRHGRRIILGDANLHGEVSVGPDGISLRIKEAQISQPALSLSGQYNLNRNSGMITIDLTAESIDVPPIRRSALAVWSDIPLVKTIFSYVQGGQIGAFALHTNGKSTDELGATENIRISGKMNAGTIFVEDKDLTFHDVMGEVVISRGILEAHNIKGSVEKQWCNGGTLRVGLKGYDAAFHLDALVKADLAALPSLLVRKHLVRNEAFLHEIERMTDLRGSAEGRLILGERLHALHVEIMIDNMNFTTRYEPLPFPVALSKGSLFFDEKILKVMDLEGSIGQSSFSGLTGSLMLDSPYILNISDSKLLLAAGEVYPWITSFEETKSALDVVRSIKGEIGIFSMALQGPLYEVDKWKFHAAGQAKGISLNAAFLPGEAESVNGMFAIKQNELSLNNIRTKLIDSDLTVSGVISPFPAVIRKIELSMNGDIGPKVNLWIAGLINLPSGIKIRAPFHIENASLAIQKDIRTELSGSFLFGTATQATFNVMKTSDKTAIRNLTARDSSSDFAADILIEGKKMDATFKGKVTAETLNNIFEEGIFSGASLEGAFSTHLDTEHPFQTTAKGYLKADHITIPWGRDIPLVLQKIALEARQQAVIVHSAEFTAGDMKFKAKGKVWKMPSSFDIDMDIYANGIEFSELEKLTLDKDHATNVKKTELLKDFPLRGILRLQSDFFKYRHFRWEPFHADFFVDRNTILITARKAELCGISTTGTILISEPRLKLDIALSAREGSFRATILCLTEANSDFTGVFDMDAHLKGEGKRDEMIDRLAGNFKLTAKDGKILKSRQLNKTFELLNQSENLKGQFPDLQKEIISYKALTIHGTVGEHRVRIEEAILDSSVIEIVANGYVDLREERLDINAFIAPLKMVNKIVRMTPVLGTILGGTLVSVPLKISGDMKNPQLTFLSPSAIGSEFLGIITRTLKLPVTLVEPIFPSKRENK